MTSPEFLTAYSELSISSNRRGIFIFFKYAKREILRILGESYEHYMNDVENFLFDKVSNVSNWLNLNYIDGTTVN
jgi:hypothetical protein